jgi:glycerate 2-kinase
MLIKNFDALATSPERKKVLEIMEAGLESIQPENVIKKNVSLSGDSLSILHKTYDLKAYDSVHLLGFGKGSGGISKMLEDMLGESLSGGFVIDTDDTSYAKLQFTKGTHPLPSQENQDFTQRMLASFAHLTEKDLVIIVVCGGGSAMLTHPVRITIDQLMEVNKALLHSGADIYQMNTLRKHLDSVKGGGLAKALYPAQVVSLVFSDVPGNDLSFIASGPTVLDETTIDDAKKIIEQFSLAEHLPFLESSLIDTPKEKEVFDHVDNMIILSNHTALDAMKDKALSLGLNAQLYSDKIKGFAHEVGLELLKETKEGTLLLAAGETTVKVTGDGKGGRNQELVLNSLKSLGGAVISSFDSDGWDNTPFAGAIGDATTVQKARERGLSIDEHISQNNSYAFFEKVEDAIITDRLPSNVSDIMIVLRV